MPDFEGFPADLFRFFADLAQNNRRDWFQENKPRFVTSVVEPMSEFITAMAPRLKKISREYRADPRPNGGSMFRIYRDVRFSKDKSPYKTHAACQFRHRAGKDAHAPGFYVHLATDGLYFGGGIWTPPSKHLGLIRDQIADSPTAWSRIRNAKTVRERGGLKGDSLKRPPRGYDPGDRHIEDLKRKSFYVMEEAEPGLARAPEFIDRVEAAFRAARPLNRFITQALDLPF